MHRVQISQSVPYRTYVVKKKKGIVNWEKDMKETKELSHFTSSQFIYLHNPSSPSLSLYSAPFSNYTADLVYPYSSPYSLT